MSATFFGNERCWAVTQSRTHFTCHRASASSLDFSINSLEIMDYNDIKNQVQNLTLSDLKVGWRKAQNGG